MLQRRESRHSLPSLLKAMPHGELDEAHAAAERLNRHVSPRMRIIATRRLTTYDGRLAMGAEEQGYPRARTRRSFNSAEGRSSLPLPSRYTRIGRSVAVSIVSAPESCGVGPQQGLPPIESCSPMPNCRQQCEALLLCTTNGISWPGISASK